MAELFDILTFDFDKIDAAVPRMNLQFPINWATPAADQPVVRVQTAVLEAGTYVYGFSVTAEFGVLNNKIEFRFSTLADPPFAPDNWDVFLREAKDDAEILPFEYTFPKVIDTPQALYLTTEMRSVNGDNACDFMDAWIQRVG